MKYSKGFTVIELFAVIVLFASAGILFFNQKANIEITARDNQRKSAINAMHFSLEESFHKANAYYPPTIDAGTLVTMDPDLFTDPEGIALGEAESDYRYEPTGCVDGKCTGYTLRADLEKEADFTKTSRND